MIFPKPVPGLVLHYAYLWAREHAAGADEGRKDRPCAVVAATSVVESRVIVTVVPITHSPPLEPRDAVAIPLALKAHLGLDGAPSWAVVNEINAFLWPGPDLRPIPGSHPARVHYGMLPPRFYAHLRDRIVQFHRSKTLNRVPRTD